MRFYQEITLLPLPSEGVTELAIWEKLYKQIHFILVTQMHNRGNDFSKIGVSFPGYSADGDNLQLGNKLRLFAETEQELLDIDLSSKLRFLSDYIHIRKINSVPPTDMFSIYKRFHVENNIHTKAKRYAKRHNISYDEAVKLFSISEPGKKYPYVMMDSETNKNCYPLAIKRVSCDSLVNNGFSSYGLSAESSVPEF